MKSYWIIDGVSERFRTLSDAKFHIWLAYTPREIKLYIQYADIIHYINDEPVSRVSMSIKNDKLKYTKILSL